MESFQGNGSCSKLLHGTRGSILWFVLNCMGRPANGFCLKHCSPWQLLSVHLSTDLLFDLLTLSQFSHTSFSPGKLSCFFFQAMSLASFTILLESTYFTNTSPDHTSFILPALPYSSLYLSVFTPRGTGLSEYWIYILQAFSVMIPCLWTLLSLI